MKALLVLLFLFALPTAWAQNAAFEGFVYDEQGQPIEGVSVRVLSRGIPRANTDAEGYFSLSGVLPNDSLLVSHIVYGRAVVGVDNQKRMVIKLSNTKRTLLPVAIVDYSTQGLPPSPLRTFFGTDTLFRVEEQPAMYPGGAMELVRFLAKTISYPTEAAENNIEGVVEISFVINKNGDPRNLKIGKSPGYGCSEEVTKAVLTMPRWFQGIQNSKSVEVSFTLTVDFVLKKKPFEKGIVEPPEFQNPNPLFVLNGVVMKEYYSLNRLNQSSIDRIEIEKGKAATDQFGEQGQNGIISITTYRD
jgi:TonB family protein